MHAQSTCFPVVLLMIYNYFYWTRMVYAGRALHNGLINKLFRAPMAFFDTTPIGRIINRVSRDIEIVSEQSGDTESHPGDQ